MLAALTTSAFTLANWFRTRWIRVRQVAGAPRGWRAHWWRRRREEALQARLDAHRKGTRETHGHVQRPLCRTVVTKDADLLSRREDISQTRRNTRTRREYPARVSRESIPRSDTLDATRETAYLCATPGGRFGEHAVLIAAYTRHGHRYRVVVGGI